MNKISKKVAFITAFITCMALIVGGTFSTFATNVDANASNVTNGTKKVRVNTEKKVDTETIIGKISNISADSVTIQVATRKKREKNNENANAIVQNQTEIQKPSIEDRFTLTGESKIYSISSADFGRKEAVNVNSENTDKKVKGEKKTYADYKVGDYVRLTVNKETPTVVKRLRNADQGLNFNNSSKKKGNYQGGYKGSYTGKTKAEKQAQ